MKKHRVLIIVENLPCPFDRRVWQEARTLARLRGICPRCGAALDLTPGGRFRLPRSVQCVHCRNELTLAIPAAA